MRLLLAFSEKFLMRSAGFRGPRGGRREIVESLRWVGSRSACVATRRAQTGRIDDAGENRDGRKFPARRSARSLQTLRRAALERPPEPDALVKTKAPGDTPFMTSRSPFRDALGEAREVLAACESEAS